MTTVTHSQTTLADRVRQVTVLIGGALAIVGAAWGSGAFGGTPIAEAAGGALSSDATVLAPASAAFSIWSLIYAALVVFGVYQVLPSKSTDGRLRSVGWWVLASMVLNVLWILVVQAESVWGSFAVIVVLVTVLVRSAALLRRHKPNSWKDVVATDVPVGLYLGWTTIATLANLAAAVANQQPDLDLTGSVAIGGSLAALAGLVVLVVVFTRWARTVPGLTIPAGLALTWGLAWIAAARAEGQPESLGMMWAAGLTACLTFAIPFAIRDFAHRDQGPPGSRRQRAAA